MSLRRFFLFALPLLSVGSFALACGGTVDGKTDRAVDPNAPGNSASTGSSGGSSGSGVGSKTCFGPMLACHPGDQQVASKSACPQDDASCYPLSFCNQTIWCSSSLACAGYPSCKPGFVEVKTCAPGKKCETSAPVCGATILCQLDESQCDGLPECNAGDIKVGSQSECLQDDAVCYQRTTCGTTIWCTGPIGGFPPGTP